jgi:hypothetical protein
VAREIVTGTGTTWGELGDDFDQIIHWGSPQKTFKNQEDQAERRRRTALHQEAAKLDTIRDAGIERQQARDVADWQRRAAESQTGTMYASPARQRQELTDRLAREKEELRRKQEDERLDLEARATVAKTPAEKAAVKKLQDALKPNQAAELQSADVEAANRKKALERDLREEQIREADRTADLRVVAGKRGYAREEAALQEHYRQEIDAAERAGDTVKKAELEKQRGLAEQAQRDNRDEEARKEHVALSIREAQATGQYAEALKQARAEEARQAHEKYNDPALEKQHMDDYDKVQAAERAEGVRKTHVDNQIKLMEATGHYRTALNLAREEQERQYRALGYTDDQVKQLMADWDKLKQAQADHSGLEAIKGLNIELERQMGHITALEAERQRLRQANPLASQSVIDEQAQKSEELRLRKQFESPAQKFQKFSGDVTAAMRPGPHGEPPIISKGRAEIEIRNELRSLMGQSGEGKMSDMSSRWSEIQNAVNEPAQLTAEEQRAFWTELTALWKAGIKIRM